MAGARGAAGLGVASRHPLPIIALVALLTVLAAWQATRVGVRANLDELLPQDSEITRLMETHGQSRAQRDWLVLLLEGEDPTGRRAWRRCTPRWSGSRRGPRSRQR